MVISSYSPLRSLLKKVTVSAILLIGTCSLVAQTQTTGNALWNEYTLDPDNHSHIPNVSYAGYKRGEVPVPHLPVVVNIQEYGGVGDGVTFNDVAIQDAIDAAWELGGGAVYFPAGTYLINQIILLHRDGVVLRGAGKGQTIIQFQNPLIDALGSTGHGTQEWNWTGGLLWIGPRDYFRHTANRRWSHHRSNASPSDYTVFGGGIGKWEIWKTLGTAGKLASVTSTHSSATRTLTVDDASQIKSGDLILMSWKNNPLTNALYREMTGGHVSFNGSSLFNGWLKDHIPFWGWPVEIESVSGTTVVLKQPTRVSILPEYDVSIRAIGIKPPVQNIFIGDPLTNLTTLVQGSGVEDLTILMANDAGSYGYNEGEGWNGIFFNRAYNCWARNVEILNAEGSVHVASSKNLSILDIDIFSPYQSKYAFSNRVMSHDILYDGFTITNTGNMTNGINTEWMSTGNVWTRGDMTKGTFDSHRMQSFDYVRTEIVLDNPAASRPGGHIDAGPFTGKRGVHWNVTVRNSDRPQNSRGQWVYHPIQYTYGAQIGIKGAAAYTLDDNAVWAMPSGNKAMLVGDHEITPEPANLYDAQLDLRLNENGIVALDLPAGNFLRAFHPIVLRAVAYAPTGKNVASVNFYANGQPLGSATTAPFNFIWEDTSPGLYMLQVEMVYVEGGSEWSDSYDVVVGQRLRLEHNNPAIYYSGSWSLQTDASGMELFTENEARITNQPGAYAEFTFRGTRARWVSGHLSQVATVSLNGVPVSTVNLGVTFPAPYRAVLWDSGELPEGNYTVRITRSSNHVLIDHFLIDSTADEYTAPLPTALFTLTPPYGVAPHQVTVNATTSRGNGETIENYHWDFGDGTVISDGNVIETHTFLNDGTYPVTLTVTNPSGTQSTMVIPYFVGNTGPVAKLLFSPGFGEAPLEVQFDAIGSSDIDGTIVRYDWAFGDGTSLTNGGATPIHIYTQPGNYTAVVTVHDNYGATHQTSVMVPVINYGSVAMVYHYDFDASNGDGTTVDDVSDFGIAATATMLNATTPTNLFSSSFTSPQGGFHGDFMTSRNTMTFPSAKWNSAIAGANGSGAFTVVMYLRNVANGEQGISRIIHSALISQGADETNQNAAAFLVRLNPAGTQDGLGSIVPSSVSISLRLGNVTDNTFSAPANLSNATTGDSDGWVMLALSYSAEFNTARLFVGRHFDAASRVWSDLSQVGDDLTIVRSTVATIPNSIMRIGGFNTPRSFRARYDNIRIYDGVLSSSELQQIEGPVAPELTAVESWRQAYFNTTQNEGDAADLADPDKNGIVNVLERALGTDPWDPADRAEPVVVPVEIAGLEYLTISYRQLMGGSGTIGTDYSAAGLTYTVVQSHDLTGPWLPAEDFVVESVLDNTPVAGVATVTIQLITPLAVGEPQFVRLRVQH